MARIEDKKAQESPDVPALGSLTEEGVVQVSPKSKRLIPWLVATAFFMQMLDGTILNTALPSIAVSLGASPLRMQKVVIAYLLTVALLIPASGWLADRFGIRKIFFIAILTFSFGSLMCALSNSLDFLIISRIIQGVGGAIMAPVGRLAVLRVVPRRELISVMSFISIPGLIGPLLGPTVGGLLVQYASWHWIFIINIPVGIVGCILTYRYMPPLTVNKVFRFDWIGFLLLGGIMICFTMGVEGIGELHMPAYAYGTLFGTAVLCLAVYIIYALKAAHPLFPLGVFRNRTFSVGIAGNLIARLGGSSMPFLMPLLLQVGIGYSPAKAGLTMIPMSLGAIVSKLFISKVVGRLGYKRMLVGNTILLGLLLMSFSLVRPGGNHVVLLLHLMTFGVINSTQFSIMNTSTLMDLSVEEASTGNGILSMVMQVSMSMGVSIGAFLLGYYVSSLSGGGIELAKATEAFKYTFITVGCISICSTLIFSFMPKNVGRENIKVADPH